MLPDYIYAETGGSPFMSISVWFVGGLVALFGSICYAELATSISVSGRDFHCSLMGNSQMFWI